MQASTGGRAAGLWQNTAGWNGPLTLIPGPPPPPADFRRRVLRETGRLLGAFTWGALGTVIGSLLAFWLMPLRSLGADSWKVAAALTARHIGGSVNYVAVSEALELSPSARMAGLAADDLIVSAYFVSLYALAKKVPPENASAAPAAGGGGELQAAAAAAAGAAGIAAAAPAAPQAWRAQPQAAGPAPPADPAAAQQAAAADQAGSSQGGGHGGGGDGRTITVLHGATALALASAICFVGTQVAAAMRYKGGSITVITAITGSPPMSSACSVSVPAAPCTFSGLAPPPPAPPNPQPPTPHLPTSRPPPNPTHPRTPLPTPAVTLATLFPRLLAPLRASGEGLAAILMQLFFASVGASGSIATVMKTAPSLFLWSAVAVSSERRAGAGIQAGRGRAGGMGCAHLGVAMRHWQTCGALSLALGT